MQNWIKHKKYYFSGVSLPITIWATCEDFASFDDFDARFVRVSAATSTAINWYVRTKTRRRDQSFFFGFVYKAMQLVHLQHLHQLEVMAVMVVAKWIINMYFFLKKNKKINYAPIVVVMLDRLMTTTEVRVMLTMSSMKITNCYRIWSAFEWSKLSVDDALTICERSVRQ